MQRIAVVGSGGAGKSTFATELGRQLAVPVIHLDEHYWQPGWVETATEEWRDRQRKLLASDRWIVDGNYTSTLDVRLDRADTVVVLAIPRWRCLIRVLRRWLQHYGRAVQAAGCPERVSPAFLRWVWNYPRSGRARLDTALARHRQNLRVVELYSPADVRDFLARAARS